MNTGNKKFFAIAVVLLSLLYLKTDGQTCPIQWTDLRQTSYNPSTNILEKTGSDGWNADAVSTKVIPSTGHGYIEYEVISGNHHQTFIGLNAVNNSTLDKSDLDFCFQFFGRPTWSTRNAYIYVHGNQLNIGVFELGEKYRIRKETNTIFFEKLAVGSSTWFVEHTASASVPASSSTFPDLFADCAIFKATGQIKATFSCNNLYVKPEISLDGGYHEISGGLLNVIINESYTSISDPINLKIYDVGRNVLYSNTTEIAGLGINFIELDLSSIGGFTEGKYYIVETSDLKGLKKYARIKYKSDY